MKVIVEKASVEGRSHPKKTLNLKEKKKNAGSGEALNKQTLLVDRTNIEFHQKPNILETYKPCFNCVELTLRKLKWVWFERRRESKTDRKRTGKEKIGRLWKETVFVRFTAEGRYTEE